MCEVYINHHSYKLSLAITDFTPCWSLVFFDQFKHGAQGFSFCHIPAHLFYEFLFCDDFFCSSFNKSVSNYGFQYINLPFVKIMIFVIFFIYRKPRVNWTKPTSSYSSFSASGHLSLSLSIIYIYIYIACMPQADPVMLCFFLLDIFYSNSCEHNFRHFLFLQTQFSWGV